MLVEFARTGIAPPCRVLGRNMCRVAGSSSENPFTCHFIPGVKMRSEGNVVKYLHLHFNAVPHIAAALLCVRWVYFSWLDISGLTSNLVSVVPIFDCVSVRFCVLIPSSITPPNYLYVFHLCVPSFPSLYKGPPPSFCFIICFWLPGPLCVSPVFGSVHIVNS